MIAAIDMNNHNNTLEQDLAALADAGLTVSPKKCLLASPEISFWGFQVSKNNIKTERQKTQAVHHAERPQNTYEVKSFLCMIRSNGQFIPDLAAATANLRELTKDINPFVWSEAHEMEFENLKKPFNSTKMSYSATTVQTPNLLFLLTHTTQVYLQSSHKEPRLTPPKQLPSHHASQQMLRKITHILM
eukprot:gene15829-7152_t